jgi:Ankyrin repeats (3 copies)
MVCHRFRWVYCQLDTLSRCPPAGICRALDELPATLDDTYKCALQRIPQERSQFAHRLFQCLIAAFRPLRVEEVAEILAIQFDEGVAPILEECCRLDDPEDAVLSVCSSLVTIVDDKHWRVVQFSHFTVKEYLESGRFSPSESGSIPLYHITLEPAHTILAQACLAMLLWLDNKIDKERLGKFPLAFYASQYFVDHAKFGNVAQIEETMKCLFDPKKPHLAAWTWIHDADSEYVRALDQLAGCPLPPRTKSLYYAALCGFSRLVSHLLMTHQEDVSAVSDYLTTALHAAYRAGRPDCVGLLLHYGADPDTRNVEDDTVCHLASGHGQTEVVKLLLQHGANVNAKGSDLRSPLHNAARKGHKEIARLLLERGADVNAKMMRGDTIDFGVEVWTHRARAATTRLWGGYVHKRGRG